MRESAEWTFRSTIISDLRTLGYLALSRTSCRWPLRRHLHRQIPWCGFQLECTVAWAISLIHLTWIEVTRTMQWNGTFQKTKWDLSINHPIQGELLWRYSKQCPYCAHPRWYWLQIMTRFVMVVESNQWREIEVLLDWLKHLPHNIHPLTPDKTFQPFLCIYGD